MTIQRRFTPSKQKVFDAVSASGIIAYINSLDLTQGKRGLFLMTAPWAALAVNFLATIAGVFLKGLIGIWLYRATNRPLLVLCRDTLANPDSSEEDKGLAHADIQDARLYEIKVWRAVKAHVNSILSWDAN